MRTFSRRIGFGRLLYWFWHNPRAAVARSAREGGPVEQFIDAHHRRAMRRVAARLPATAKVPTGAPEVTFLTGRKFWYQTALCCWSLRRCTDQDLCPVFIDDGTMDAAVWTEAQRVFPGCRFSDRREIENRLNATLPVSNFSALRGQRKTYIHLRKLTDVHAGAAGWRLVLDSDMLFFREPTQLLDWLAAPARPVHMLDIAASYGYPAETLARLAAPHRLPDRLNVGICGLRSDAIDWDQLEAWCAELLQRHGTSYYLEQALTALWTSRSDPLRLLEADYRLMPSENECRTPTAALHHYVAESKRGYYRNAWRRAIPAELW